MRTWQACIIIVDTLLVAPPGIPQPSRWDKLYTSLDFFVIGFACGGMLSHLIKLGWRKMLSEIVSAADIAESQSFLGEQWNDSYDKVKMGQRKGKVIALLDSHLMVARLLILWVRTGPVRHLSHWLLYNSRQQSPINANEDTSGPKLPPCCDLVNDEFSPVVTMQQFYSEIMADGSDWQRVVQGYAPEANCDEIRNDFRRQNGAAASEAHRRHTWRLRRWPFPLARTIDHRLPTRMRESTCFDWIRSKKCCNDAGLGRRLKHRDCWNHVSEMMDVTAQLLLIAIFYAICLTTALAECTHARNQQLSHFQNCWGLFSAFCTRADALAHVRGPASDERNKGADRKRKLKLLQHGQDITADGLSASKATNSV